MASAMWALAQGETMECMYTISDPSARVWIFEMMAKLNMDEFIKVLVMLWAMWTALFEGSWMTLLL
jgi:hypothetical protein